MKKKLTLDLRSVRDLSNLEGTDLATVAGGADTITTCLIPVVYTYVPSGGNGGCNKPSFNDCPPPPNVPDPCNNALSRNPI